MQKERPTYEDLESENRRLAAKLERMEASKRAKRGMASWLGRRISGIFIGQGLQEALKAGLEELRATGRLSAQGMAHIGDALVRRLTRVRAVVLVMGALPFVLLAFQTYLMGRQNGMLANQNRLMRSQNDKVVAQNVLIQSQNRVLGQQKYLQEANRRSSLVVLFANVMDAIDSELKDPANTERELSQQLVGRIVSLSRSLKPYRYLKDDELTPLLSPERTQLLINLVNAELGEETYRTIFASGDFSHLELRDFTFDDFNLSYIRFDHSILDHVKFRNCRFEGNSVMGLQGNHVYFERCDLTDLIITDSSFEYLRFWDCSFSGGLDLRDSCLGHFAMETSSVRSLDLENCTFTESYVLGSYITYLRMEGEAGEDGAPGPGSCVWPDATSPDIGPSDGSIGIGVSWTYALHLTLDDRYLEALAPEDMPFFYKFYLDRLECPETVLDVLDTPKYLLETESGPRRSLVLKDPAHAPERVWQFLNQGFRNETYYAFEGEWLLLKTRRLIDAYQELHGPLSN